MSWDAIDSLDEARTATQSLLFPVSWRAWLRLAVVTFFVGGVGGGGGAGQAAQGATSSPTPPGAGLGGVDLPPVPDVSPESLGAVVVAAVAVLAVVVVGHALVGAVMEFVLVACLRTRRVELRRPFRQYLGPGVRLFAFRLGVVVVLVALAALPVLVVVGVLSITAVGVLFVPLLVVVVVVAWLAGLLVLRLTTELVVPTMIAEGRGVLSAWRRVVPLVRSMWAEVALYLAIRIGLGIAASLVVGLVVGLAALVVIIPFVLAGGAVVLAVGMQGPGLVALGVLGVVFLLAVVAVSVVVQVPVVTYFRYYGLFVLGALDDRLDLVRGRPSDVRNAE
ncbi:DUF7544 domain-containing protein [Salinigranum marinum]|uniref:DUF7544 domain-containing protein n=1 Tax=Salinigranum marinum TaxID=1515595 RepID=UPI002989A5A4|nr:hypothetical protein [Salinigranum marinum]